MGVRVWLFADDQRGGAAPMVKLADLPEKMRRGIDAADRVRGHATLA
jgi:hypothetical protein